MRVIRLELRDVPGIDRRGLTLDGLDASVVLILGPNGSGKSTARRCLEQLLFGSHRSLINAHIVGTFTVEGNSMLRAEQRNGHVVWTRDGAPTTPPSLPPEMYSGCYAISAHALLAAGATEQGFASTVRREMSGGYDVAVIRQSMSAGALAQQYGLILSKEVRGAKQRLREVEGDLDALAGDEDRLDELRAGRAEADEAAARRTHLREKLDDLQRALEREPALAARVQKGARTIAGLDTQRAELEATGPIPPPDSLATAVQLASTLQGIDTDLRRAESDLARAQSEEATARHDLEGVDTEGVRPPTRADLDAIQTAWTEGSTLRSELRSIDKALALLPVAEGDVPSVRSVDTALDELNRWLANAPRATSHRHPALVPAAAALIVASIVAAILVSPWLVVGSGLGAAWMAALLLGTRGDAAGAEARASAAAAFERSGFAAPAEWDGGSVASLVRELRDQRDHSSRIEHAATDRARLTRDRTETHAQFTAREESLEALGESLGLAPWTGGLDLAVLAQRILALDSAEQATASAQGALQSLHDRRTEHQGRAAEALGLAASTQIDPAAMHQRVAALQKRAAKLDSLEDGRAREVEGHAEAREAHDVQQRLIATAAAALGSAPGESLADVHVRFAPEIQTLDRTLEGRDDVVSEIVAIETSLRIAREKGDWEEAQAARSSLEGELTETFATRVDALCAGALLDDIENEYERSSRPAVLERAAALFAGFTHQRYELVALQADDGEARFAANDADNGEQRSLDELSDGTRMQLLLALRIAFAEHHEHGEAVPLVLDEAFSMSDRARVHAMIEAVGHLAREGRQVLYLGADDGLEAEWRAVASQAGHDAPQVCRLADAQRDSRSVTSPAELALPQGPDIPDPQGFTPEDYGLTVGASLLDPHDDASSLHLFHLLRGDLSTLATLLRQRITTLGRWEALVERGGGQRAIGSASLAEGLSVRTAAARALVEAWHVGRGHRVTRTELEESKAVTDAFLDRMCEYLDDVGGSAVTLIEELDKPGTKREERLKGFRSNSRVLLRDHLIATGALDLRTPLTPEMQDERVRAAAPDLDPVEATRLAAILRAQLEREMSPSTI